MNKSLFSVASYIIFISLCKLKYVCSLEKKIKTTVHRLPSYLILRQDFYKALLLYAFPDMYNYK